jgi:hypothetical protein
MPAHSNSSPLPTLIGRLSKLSAYLCHDPVYDWLRGRIREIERPAVGNNFDGLASGIADYLAGSTLRDMVFELLADLGGNFVVQVVSELSHKLTACNHKPILLALVAK